MDTGKLTHAHAHPHTHSLSLCFWVVQDIRNSRGARLTALSTLMYSILFLFLKLLHSFLCVISDFRRCAVAVFTLLGFVLCRLVGGY